jgi:hypothetical protein
MSLRNGGVLRRAIADWFVCGSDSHSFRHALSVRIFAFSRAQVMVV